MAEVEEFPCITTMAPWQPWYIGRQGNPGDPASWTNFEFTYHYFWGLEDIIAVFAAMWGQLDTNKVVGGLYRSLGQEDAYPFALSPGALDKLRYVHDVICETRSTSAQKGPDAAGSSHVASDHAAEAAA